MNRQFTEEILMAKKHMKRYSSVMRIMKNGTKIIFFAHYVGKKLKRLIMYSVIRVWKTDTLTHYWWDPYGHSVR